ncbi:MULTISPECIES: hypothetical protein [Microcystis]|nr:MULTISPECIES: hypothetical protein [Microcystis]MCA2716570.1 hypothetical protein [Microcystis sp. M169S2]WNF13088.1 hypothetical protein RKE53_13180 [Microcystis aeruginosa NRERC-214]
MDFILLVPLSDILTNFGDLETAIIAYQKIFDIEEMFQDFKSGGYSLEGS